MYGVPIHVPNTACSSANLTNTGISGNIQFLIYCMRSDKDSFRTATLTGYSTSVSGTPWLRRLYSIKGLLWDFHLCGCLCLSRTKHNPCEIRSWVINFRRRRSRTRRRREALIIQEPHSARECRKI